MKVFLLLFALSFLISESGAQPLTLNDPVIFNRIVIGKGPVIFNSFATNAALSGTTLSATLDAGAGSIGVYWISWYNASGTKLTNVTFNGSTANQFIVTTNLSWLDATTVSALIYQTGISGSHTLTASFSAAVGEVTMTGVTILNATSCNGTNTISYTGTLTSATNSVDSTSSSIVLQFATVSDSPLTLTTTNTGQHVISMVNPGTGKHQDFATWCSGAIGTVSNYMGWSFAVAAHSSAAISFGP